MSAHTPGPWGLIVGDAGPIVFSGNRGNMVAQCVRGISSIERQANARLIAAAPELLEALTNLLANQDGSSVLAGFTPEQIKAMPYLKPARVAIAKATGAAA